jgi:hypothetical protein
MKKCFLIAVLMAQIGLYAQQPGNGKVKIYLRTISCIKESSDDILDFDGKGNEVFVTLFYSVAASNGTTRYINKITSAVYGDVNGRPGRYKAGTAGNSGGIKAGDVIYANPNTEAMMPTGDERFKGQFMFDAELGPTDIITVVPVLWEWDSDAKNTQNSFESFLSGSFNSINVHTAPIAQRFNTASSPFIYSDGTNCIDLAGMSRILQGVNGFDGNRPLGMALNGTYNPNMFVMNQTILNNWRSVTDLYKEECRFNYNESYLGNTRDHGNYDITIHIDYTPPVNTTAAPVKIFKRPNTVITINPVVTGIWKGTWGYGDNSTTNFLSYQLNNDGTMLLLSQVGATEARGTYTFGNNILTASYSYLGGGAIAASGVYDPSTGKLTGTWGHNNSATDGGKWVLIK